MNSAPASNHTAPATSPASRPGFHGAGYVIGTSIGKSAIFCRIAGTAAAAEESELKW